MAKSLNGAVAPAYLLPVEILQGVFGLAYRYEASEQQLLAAGLLLPKLIPAKRRGSCRHGACREKVSRLGNGLLRLTIPADVAACRDMAFKGFMSVLLSHGEACHE